MDGYAVRTAEATTGATLPVVGESAAGHRFEAPLPPNSAVADLNARVIPKVFALGGPPRVVIDLADDPSAPPVARIKPAPKPSPPDRSVPKAKPPAPAAVAKAATNPAFPRARSAASQRVAAGPRKPIVVIDPGHGGRDPGARGVTGDYEKEIVMDIAKRVARRLENDIGAKVILTRKTDDYVSLAARKDAANRLDADVFVSIHANASANREAHGIETYYLKNSNDRATLRLAKLENGVDSLLGDEDVSGDADLPYILSDMVQGYKEADSILLANHIQKELVGYMKPRYKQVRDLGVKQGPFYVLDGTYMPSVLVETAFLTHKEEARRVGSALYRDRLAEGISRGIERYLSDERVAGLY